ncbi:MAG: hypothetical protein K0R29_991 [Pseudobdellovibrio sp.]|jgi:para-aminobenzoate synthetase component 1|nr:hypothetical protein [Pseudobdellovibrio sp.]
MKKLFCFYKNSEFLASDDYTVCTHSDESGGLHSFLAQVQKRYPSQMKVLQINFEAQTKNFSGQIPLYPCNAATVFVLNTFEIVSEAAVLNEMASAGHSEFQFQSLELKSSFIEKVNIIKKEIAAGRLYQANITAPLKAVCTGTAESVFKQFSSSLSGQYKALLPLSDTTTVVSFSPELFLQKENSVLITRPIKGSLRSDRNFEQDLISDSKEDAELSMIVDLLRNDLNRIENAPENALSKAKVTKHRAALQLGYIQHTYSEIEVETDKSLPEILDCVLPGGSISGCPKLESLILISELETYKRQVYTGTIGWWMGSEFCLNLAIRTFIKHDNSLYYHAGCGIVYDSDAEKEWSEFILKTGRINASF